MRPGQLPAEHGSNFERNALTRSPACDFGEQLAAPRDAQQEIDVPGVERADRFRSPQAVEKN